MTQQNITPELQHWISAHLQAGHPEQSILKAMLQAGWQEDVARQALKNMLHAPAAFTVASSSLQPEVAIAFPFIDLTGSPRELDAGDRRVQVVTSLRQPQIVVLANLLSYEECDALIEAAQPRMQRSLIVVNETGADQESPERTSRGMFFERGESPLVSQIESRIARLVDWPVDHGEGLQVLHYCKGTEYRPHYDYFDPAQPGTPTILRRGGQRLATVVMYLNNPARGGGTVFPDLKLEVAPQKGNAVFFSYPVAHPVSQSLHGGAPLLEGEKWVATKWLRERVFT